MSIYEFITNTTIQIKELFCYSSQRVNLARKLDNKSLKINSAFHNSLLIKKFIAINSKIVFVITAQLKSVDKLEPAIIGATNPLNAFALINLDNAFAAKAGVDEWKARHIAFFRAPVRPTH